MRHNWYVRDEPVSGMTRDIFVDLDGYKTRGGLVLGSDGKPVPPKPVLARGRLLGAVKSGVLRVDGAWVYPSRNRGHWHMAIRLSEPMPFALANLWAHRFLDDPYRNAQNAMRIMRGVTDSLLITPEAWPGYQRVPDYVCYCSAKHTNEVMSKCPVAIMLRGSEASADYFGPREITNAKMEFGRII